MIHETTQNSLFVAARLEGVPEDVVRDTASLPDAFGLFSSSASDSDEKWRGFSGRLKPSFPTVTPSNSSETKVNAMRFVP
jgi:hypothetical protein